MTRKSTAERAEEFAKNMERTRGVPHWHDLRDAYLAGAEYERAAEPTAGSEEPTLSSFSVKGGVAEFKVGNAQNFARHLLSVFWDELQGAKNYVEISFKNPDGPEQYTVTVQKHPGETPAQKIARLEGQPAPTQANNPEIPEGSTAGSEDPAYSDAFEDEWKLQQGSVMLKNSCEGKEWKKTIARFFYRQGHRAASRQPAPTAQPDDRLELAIRALEFYANRGHWGGFEEEEDGLLFGNAMLGDGVVNDYDPEPNSTCYTAGRTAREALEKIAAKTKERKT